MPNISPAMRYWMSHPRVRRAPISSTARLAAWFAMSKAGRPVTVDFKTYGVRFRCPPEWRGVARLAFAMREHYDAELAYLGQLVQPGGVVVDGGAHYGSYTVALARITGPAGLVLAYEPAQHAYSLLETNIALNHLDNALPIRAALGAETGTGTLHLHDDPSRSSLGARRAGTTGSEQVAVCRLDSSVREYTHRPVTFIKLDVEGAELLALMGARRILQQDRPTVLFEFQPAAARRLGLDPLGTWELLSRFGYEFSRLSGDGRKLPVEQPPASGTHNLIAVSDSRAASSGDAARPQD